MNITPSKSTRFWEIDTLRGLAVVFMILYHFMWDLSYFAVYPANMSSPFWQTIAESIGATFIFVMGVSLTLKHHQTQVTSKQRSQFSKYLIRGSKIFAWGMLITVGTYFFIGRGFVVFGILHLLGISTILAYPFLQSRWGSLVMGLCFIGAGMYIENIIVSFPWLIWLGFRQIGRHMVDYYPFLPWFGVALIGIFVGYTLYPEKTPHFSLPDLSNLAPIRGLSFLGQHSLLIYLIHQPILIGGLIVLGVGSI